MNFSCLMVVLLCCVTLVVSSRQPLPGIDDGVGHIASVRNDRVVGLEGMAYPNRRACGRCRVRSRSGRRCIFSRSACWMRYFFQVWYHFSLILQLYACWLSKLECRFSFLVGSNWFLIPTRAWGGVGSVESEVGVVAVACFREVLADFQNLWDVEPFDF